MCVCGVGVCVCECVKRACVDLTFGCVGLSLQRYPTAELVTKNRPSGDSLSTRYRMVGTGAALRASMFSVRASGRCMPGAALNPTKP